MYKVSRVLVVIGAIAVATTSAQAQYASDFEGLVGSSAGIPLTGQDGFYIPGGTTSVDYLVYFYGGNAWGCPRIPRGGISSWAAPVPVMGSRLPGPSGT